jgi:ligand-binding SRPBCC domain-containing protein
MAAKTHRLYRKTRVPAPVDEVFDFFSRVENLNRITPAWVNFTLPKTLPQQMALGTQFDFSLRLSGFPVRWKTEITGWDPPRSFEDTQVRGPYRQWVHFHNFTPDADETVMEDAVVYRSPGWILEPLVDFWYVRRRLEKIFDYREHQVLSIFSGRGTADRLEPETDPAG